MPHNRETSHTAITPWSGCRRSSQVKFGQADDLSKIRGRFKTKLTLASAGVEEVIQRRLLAKILDEPDQLIAIYEQGERFKADVDFQKRDSQQQQEVLRPTSAAKADVQAATKPGTALLRLNRYRTDDVPKQLQRIAALAAPPDSPPTPAVKVVPASALKPSCPLSQAPIGPRA